MKPTLSPEATGNAPKAVIIGGGNGTGRLASGMIDHGFDVTAVVTTMDNGGSTGRLREQHPGLIGVGDIRQVMQTMAGDQELAAREFAPRDESRHALGNKKLVETALEAGGVHMIEHAIEHWSGRLALRGSVMPITLDNAHLRLDFPNKPFEPIIGEYEVAYSTDPIHSGQGKLSLSPQAAINPRVVQAILDSDITVLGPGNLYGSVIPPLLVEGVPETIWASRRPFIMFSNIINSPRTQGFSVADHVNEIEMQTGLRPDIVIAHRDDVSEIPVSQELVTLTEPKPSKLIVASIASPEIPALTDTSDELASVRSRVVHCGHRAGAVLLNHLHAA